MSHRGTNLRSSLDGRPKANYDYDAKQMQISNDYGDSAELFYKNTTEGRQRVFLSLCNTGLATSVRLYRVPSGGSASASNAFWYGVPFEANESQEFPFELVLKADESIYAQAEDSDQVNLLATIYVEL